jgi:hypothetical protein
MPEPKKIVHEDCVAFNPDMPMGGFCTRFGTYLELMGAELSKMERDGSGCSLKEKGKNIVQKMGRKLTQDEMVDKVVREKYPPPPIVRDRG